MTLINLIKVHILILGFVNHATAVPLEIAQDVTDLASDVNNSTDVVDPDPNDEYPTYDDYENPTNSIFSAFYEDYGSGTESYPNSDNDQSDSISTALGEVTSTQTLATTLTIDLNEPVTDQLLLAAQEAGVELDADVSLGQDDDPDLQEHGYDLDAKVSLGQDDDLDLLEAGDELDAKVSLGQDDDPDLLEAGDELDNNASLEQDSQPDLPEIGDELDADASIGSDADHQLKEDPSGRSETGVTVTYLDDSTSLSFDDELRGGATSQPSPFSESIRSNDGQGVDSSINLAIEAPDSFPEATASFRPETQSTTDNEATTEVPSGEVSSITVRPEQEELEIFGDFEDVVKQFLKDGESSNIDPYPRIPRQNDLEDQGGNVVADVDGAVDAPEDAGKAEKEDCEEAWDYIQFLRQNVNDKVEQMLEDIREARKGGVGYGIESTVANILDQVLDIRDKVLDRISELRKDGIQTCPNQDIRQQKQLNDIRQEIMSILLGIVDRDADNLGMKNTRDQLLKFRVQINNEIMRVLMLPQEDRPIRNLGEGCDNCQIFEEIRANLSKVIVCAGGSDGGIDVRYGLLEPDQEEGGEAQEQVQFPPEDDDQDGGVEGCSLPSMYFMDLISLMRQIDLETERIFAQLFGILTNKERSDLEDSLNSLKGIRDMIEDTVRQLSDAKDKDDIENIVLRSLDKPRREATDLLEKCQTACGSGSCNSCGAKIVTDLIDKMTDYLESYNTTQSTGSDYTEINEFIRDDLMQLINTINKDEQELLSLQIQEELKKCDLEKLEVLGKVKNPLWMLVNTTIFAEGIDEPSVMVQTMMDILEDDLQRYCSDTLVEVIEEGSSCQWEEYKQIQRYVNKVDTMIQESLFKPPGDSAKKSVQMGLIEIKILFDKRVEKLFANNLQCPEEATTIKKSWMPQLGKCLTIFMNPDLNLTRMPRSQRIQCPKDLRELMEDRRSALLKTELDISLDRFGGVPDGEDGPIYK